MTPRSIEYLTADGLALNKDRVACKLGLSVSCEPRGKKERMLDGRFSDSWCEAKIFSGGMGANVSCPELAQEVSKHPSGVCTGFISGTALEVVMARELQLGDPAGVWRRQFEALEPLLRPDMRQVLRKLYEHYHVPGGKQPGKAFAKVPAPQIDSSAERSLLTLAANFAAVRRAKDGHERPIGINYLRKIELQLLPALLGAILAGADYVAVGAGNPEDIPGVIRDLCALEPVKLPVHVARAEPGQEFYLELDPREFLVGDGLVERPKFLAIISSHLQAIALADNEASKPDGWIVENDSAGGHNAPPLGGLRVGPVVWGPKDVANFEAIVALGLPSWLAGGFGSAEGLAAAIRLGARGVQVGTPFALSLESGMDKQKRFDVLTQIWRRKLVVSSTRLSPTGFPLKAVVSVPGTVAEAEVNEYRMTTPGRAACDLGYLATPFWDSARGRVDYICPAEPRKTFKDKGGSRLRAPDAICLCNALMATVGLAQIRHGEPEPSLITLGRNVEPVREVQLANRSIEFTAAQVIEQILRVT